MREARAEKGRRRKASAGLTKPTDGRVKPAGNRDPAVSPAASTRQKPRDSGGGGGSIGSPAPMGWAKSQPFYLHQRIGLLVLSGRGRFCNRWTHHARKRNPPQTR